jgi:hypothetical protein
VVYVRSTKNRCSPPWRSRTLLIEYGAGIDNVWSVYEMLLGAGAIQNNKGWCAFDADYSSELAAAVPKKWQGGYQGLKTFCAEDPSLWPKLIEVYKEAEARLDENNG